MDACFVYIYQYEPYLRDPVAYPKVQVRGQMGGERHNPAVVRDLLGPFEAGAKNTSQTGGSTNGIYCPTKKVQIFSSGMAGSRSSRITLSLDCVFFACAPLPGSAVVVWQRQPWVALGFHSFYLATTEECEPLIPQLKYKS